MPAISGSRTRSIIGRAWQPSTTRSAAAVIRAAPARPQPRPRPTHRRRPLAVGGLHPARTADAVRPDLPVWGRRRCVSIRLPSLCSIESSHPASRPASGKASLTERARCYPLPWTHCITGCRAGLPPRPFSLDHWWEVSFLQHGVFLNRGPRAIARNAAFAAACARPETLGDLRPQNPRIAISLAGSSVGPCLPAIRTG